MNVYTNIIPCMFMPMKSQMKLHHVCYTYTHHRIKMYKNLIQSLLIFQIRKQNVYKLNIINVLKQSAPLWIR